MSDQPRDLLEVLKQELTFVESGGYRHPSRATWRPQFLFQDSPTCLNFDCGDHPKQCVECELLKMVPKDQQLRQHPCRYIPLNPQGDTLDLLYRTSTREETEAIFVNWLKNTIARLEQEKGQGLRASEDPSVHVRGRFLN